MEPDNASPLKSIIKSNKSNGQLIDQILAETKAQLTKKHKPPSDESPLIANNRPKKRTSVKNDSLISELVNRELEGLSKKRKRHSKELNDSGAILKKIKLEPVSEDEQNAQNGTALSFSSPKADKKGSYRSLSRERDELERLFSNTQTSVVNSTINAFESSSHIKLTDLSLSRIFKQEKQSSSEGEMPMPDPQKKQVPILRPVKEQILSADETPTQTLSSFNSQRTGKDSTISTSTTVPFHRSDTSGSDNESTVPVSAHSIQSSPVKKMVLEDKPTKRRSLEKSKSEKLQKRSNSKLLSITKKSNMNLSSHSQRNPNKAQINQHDSSSEEDALPPPQIKPKRRSSVPAPIKTRASESSSEELTLPTPIHQIKQEKVTQKKKVPVPKAIKTRASSASESSYEEEPLPKPMQLKQEKTVSVPVPIKSQPTSDSDGDSEASTVPTPVVVKQEKEKKPVSVPRPIKQRVSSGSESESKAPALPKPLQMKERAIKPKKRVSAPASVGKVLLSDSENNSAQLAKTNPGEQKKVGRRKAHSCILMESAKTNSEVKNQKSPAVVKKQKSQLAKKQVAVATPVEAPPGKDSASDSEEEVPKKKDLDLSVNGKMRRSSPEKFTENKPLAPNRKKEESSSSGSEDEPVPKANVSKPGAQANGKSQETESSSSDAAGSSDEASDSGTSSRSEEKTRKSSPVKGKPPQVNKKDSGSESSSDEEAHSRNSSNKRKEENGENVPRPKKVVLQTKFLHLDKVERQRQETESSSSDAGPSNEASDSDSDSRSEQKPASKPSPLQKKPQLNNKDTATENSSDEEAASSRPSKTSSQPRKTSLTPNKTKNASSKDSPASKSLPVNAAKGKKRRQPSESSVDSDEAPPKKRSRGESLRESAPEPVQKASTAMKLKSPVSAPKQQNVIVESNGLAPESSDYEQGTPVQRTISQKASWMEILSKNFPGLEQQHMKTTLPENSVKYSLLLVPKHINPSSLINLKCDLKKESPVSLNNMAYVFQPLPTKPDPVILSLKRPKLVELESVIYFKQFLPKKPMNEIEVPVREDVVLPSITKTRHPMFGANYKKEIRLDHSVKQNLHQADERKEKVMLKTHTKRKSKRKSTSHEVEENVLSIFNSISTGGDNLTDMDQLFADEVGEVVAKGSKSNNNVEEKKKRRSKKAVSDEAQCAHELVEKTKKKKRKIVDE